MPVDVEDEGRGNGMLRGIFDAEHGKPHPTSDDLLARAGIALMELVRWLRRDEDRIVAMQERDRWNQAYLEGYIAGRAAAMRGERETGPMRASQVAPPRIGRVCQRCRAKVAEEIGGFGLEHHDTARTLGDPALLDTLARELGADISGHPCDAREGLGTCACGCAVWRELGGENSLVS